MKRATALRYARDTDLTAAQPEQRSQAKGEHPMLTGITVPTGATKDTRVWVVNRFHNRITTRKIGGDIIRFGSFPLDIVSVTATKGEAIKAMLECRAAELNNAMREMARAERAMASALKLASKEGHADPQNAHKKRRVQVPRAQQRAARPRPPAQRAHGNAWRIPSARARGQRARRPGGEGRTGA